MSKPLRHNAQSECKHSNPTGQARTLRPPARDLGLRRVFADSHQHSATPLSPSTTTMFLHAVLISGISSIGCLGVVAVRKDCWLLDVFLIFYH